MTRLRVLLSRLLDLVLGGRRERRLRQEIDEHLRLLTDEYITQGLSPADARRAACRAFGPVDRLEEAYREQRGLPVIDAYVQDARFAVRLLRRDPWFALTAVGVLGLGIGVNNMLFTVLNAHTLRGLPVREAHRLVFISAFDDRVRDLGASYADFLDWQRRARAVESMSAYVPAPITIAEERFSPGRFDGAFVAANVFQVIGIQPVLGRDFAPGDERPGSPAVAILGTGAWQVRYGADPRVLGQSVLVNGVPATIIGVVPDHAGFPSTAQVWVPLSQLPGLTSQPRSARSLRVLARVGDDRTMADARAEMEAIAAQLSTEHPDTNTNVRARLVPVNEQLLGNVTDPAWLAFMAVGCLVVLISCANAANLMLARSVLRAREIAIRASLGASRRRVIRQLLIEGAVLAALGGTLGLGLSAAGVRLFRTAIPEGMLPYWFDYSLDIRVLGTLITVSAATVFVFALLPAIHASRSDVTVVLKDGGRGPVSRRGRRWTTAFLAAEFGLAVVLLAQFVVNVRTAAPVLRTDAAIDRNDVLTGALTLPAASYPAPEHRVAFHERLLERIGGLPDVASASFSSALPLGGAEARRLEVADRPELDAESTVRAVTIGSRYFETLGLTLTKGVDFSSASGGAGQLPAIVNERFVEQFLGNRDPIGQRIRVFSAEQDPATRSWLTIVGVAPSIRQRPLPQAEPVVYLRFGTEAPATASLLVRSRLDHTTLASMLRDEIAALDRHLPLFRIRSLSGVIHDAQWNGRLSNRLFIVLTFIAVALSTVGLYAVTAHAVNLRTHEIGIRVALGAKPRQILVLIARRVAAQVGLGFLAGIALTRLWNAVFATGRPDVTATDPMSLLAVAMILIGLAALATFIPARRATRLEPVTAIRRE